MAGTKKIERVWGRILENFARIILEMEYSIGGGFRITGKAKCCLATDENQMDTDEMRG